MDSRILLSLVCTIGLTSAWSLPYNSVPRAPMRFTRFAPPPPAHLRPHLHAHPHTHPHTHYRSPVSVETSEIEEQPQHRPKRGHDDFDHDHHYDHHRDHHHNPDHSQRITSGITGPVHTFVKTDKNANYKWGVRHHVGDKYAS